MGSHLFFDAGRDPTRYGFPELMGTISDSVTLMTLIMVALCWPFSAGPLIEWAKKAKEEPVAPEVEKPRWIPRLLPSMGAFALLAGGNLIGVLAAIFMHQMLTR